MSLTSRFYEVAPLVSTLGPAIISSFYDVNKRWQDFMIYLLGALFVFFAYIFFTEDFSSSLAVHSLFDIRYNKISIFIGAIYCGALFM